MDTEKGAVKMEMSGLKNRQTAAIGIMSGTSLDGLDICLAEFWFAGRWHFRIIVADCIPYSDEWRGALSTAHLLSSDELTQLSSAFGKYTAQQVNAFIGKNNLTKPDLVCSHGHTVFHNPSKRFTLQIGSGDEIAKLTGMTTVSDFRSLDVSLGGQGAPLVPIGDELLFSDFEACLNLGGFSNISFREGDERRAFDVCPVNIALNPLALTVGKPFDENGGMARSGTVNGELLRQLNGLSLYKEGKRPSLAREWLEQSFWPLVEKADAPLEDKLRTVTEHAAMQISSVINAKATNGRVLTTGGGAKNGFLIERIAALSHAEVVVPKAEIVDFKEALIFAFLGVLRVRDEVNVLRSVTGADSDSCSGVVSMP